MRLPHKEMLYQVSPTFTFLPLSALLVVIYVLVVPDKVNKPDIGLVLVHNLWLAIATNVAKIKGR